MNSRNLFATVCAGAVLALGCNQGSSAPRMNFKHNKEGTGTKVATFAGDSITAEELTQRFSEMSPYARTRYQTPEQKKEFIDGVARFELLAQEAERRGLQNDPEVVETAKKVMVQRLIQKELDEKPMPVPDTEVAAFYEKHKSDYVKPEMLRLSQLFLAAPKEDAAVRGAKKAKAEELQKKAAGAPAMDFQAFAALVRESSEEPRTKPLDGDMRYLSREELSTQYGPELVAATEGLAQVGQVTPVVETDKGFHILKLQGRQAALNLTLEQVKTQLQSRILYEKRQQTFAAFLDGLKKKADYQVHEGALAKIEVDLKAPAKEPKGPTPGFIPAPTPSPDR